MRDLIDKIKGLNTKAVLYVVGVWLAIGLYILFCVISIEITMNATFIFCVAVIICIFSCLIYSAVAGGLG